MEEDFYLIRLAPASYLSNKVGWGPTFTNFREDAKHFPSPKAAQRYIDENLPSFGCDIVHGF